MATKEENIQRLRELATRLGRDPDVSGSAAELSQRVMEWEEEAERRRSICLLWKMTVMNP